LFGKLTSLAFGDLFKMPSEVVVQCFFRLDYDHLNHQILSGWNSDSPRPFDRILPPKDSLKMFSENRRLLMSLLFLANLAIVLG
jgi:hypothetical protein